MGADHYHKCPKCKGIDPKLTAELKQKEEALEEAYGKVDSKEYLKLVAEFKRASKEVPKNGDDECLASYEDNFFSEIENVFNVSFNMECYVCNWSFNYSVEVPYD